MQFSSLYYRRSQECSSDIKGSIHAMRNRVYHHIHDDQKITRESITAFAAFVVIMAAVVMAFSI